MKYLIGGSTGIVKLVETADRSLHCCSPLEEQRLERQVTCMRWSGGRRGDEETELVVGRADGSVETYGYPSMNRKSEFKLESSCVGIFILCGDLSPFGKVLYDKGAATHPSLYPIRCDHLAKVSDKYICCVFQNGYCLLLNYESMGNNSDNNDINDAITSATVDVKRLHAPPKDKEDDDDVIPPLSLPGIVKAYKLKGPITAVAHHTVLTHRMVMGGPNVAPFLFDVFNGSLLWTGKLPHETLLGLQSHLDARSICFLEDIGEDVIAVSTSDSCIYIYDMTCQRKPVYDMNVCDRRSRCLSAKQLALHKIRDYNTDRKNEIKKTVNDFYTSDSRNIVKLVTLPRRVTEEQGTYERHDTCDLFASDNVGSIYHLSIVTGDSLVQFLMSKLRKYQPDGDEELTREKALDHLIQARKRFGSAGANDRPIHCAPAKSNQYICELKGCYGIHNGAVVDISCIGHYLISVGLDRFTNVYNIKTRKRLFHLYCNQKQTCLLPFHSHFYEEYEASEFKQLEHSIPDTKKRLTDRDDVLPPSEADIDIDNEGSMGTSGSSSDFGDSEAESGDDHLSEDIDDSDDNSEEESEIEDDSSDNYDNESDDDSGLD